MNSTQDLPRIIAGTLHRFLQPEDLAAICRYDHDWYRYYSLLLTTGIWPADAAMLTYNNINWARSVIGHFRQTTNKYEEVSVPPQFLDEYSQGVPLDTPLFADLYSDIEDREYRLEQLSEKLGPPTDYLESILSAEGRPVASLVAFRVTYDQIIRKSHDGSGPADLQLKAILPEKIEVPRS